MQYKILVITLACFFKLTLFNAQKISFAEQDYENPGFQGLYGPSAGSYPLLNETKLFKEKLVKSVNFYDAKKQLFCFFELDAYGKITGRGYQGDNYFGIAREKIVDQDTLENKTWFAGNLLMREDSLLVSRKVYRNADTLMEYREFSRSVYKRGALINKQNKFYAGGNLNSKRKYRTDYDSTVLFLGSKENYRSGFVASVRDATINLDTNKLKEHRFFKAYKRAPIHSAFVDGEELGEKPASSIFCGTRMPEPDDLQTLNENGLFEARYFLRDSEKILACFAKYEYYDKP